MNHWVCVASDGDQEEIKLLDSLNLKISRSLLLQIAAMFKPADITVSKLYVNRLPVQQQTGTLDCGLFAIAFAVELCNGEDPSKMVFIQEKMRDHLLTCLEKRKFDLFPKKRHRSKKITVSCLVTTYNIHCFCRYPETYDKKMVECCQCKEWYHFSCIGITSSKDVQGNWNCSKCAGHGVPLRLGKPQEFSPPPKK